MDKFLEHLKNMPLFSDVEEKDLVGIAEHLTRISYEKDAVIIKEGDTGDSFFIIEEGVVNVMASLPDEEEDVVLSRLKEGEYFGEMSLITGAPRSATIVAETDVKLLELLKDDFDKYILDNPSITMSLTHKLSERLIASNRALRQREKYYKDKISPKGSLEDVAVIKLLKYCEDNSLTGELILRNNTRLAVLSFDKGQVEKISYDDKDEDEAMDEIINWDKGDFIIEPVIFNVSEEDNEDKKTDSDAAAENEIENEAELEDPVTTDSVELFHNYLQEKFQEIICFSGSKSLQSVIDKSYKKFDKFFDLKNILTIEIIPELKIVLADDLEITDKVALSVAVLLSDIINTIEYDIFGINLWSPKSNDIRINSYLKSKLFFEYYEQAGDFTQM
jgi:CRP-like cAMP-binding protein